MNVPIREQLSLTIRVIFDQIKKALVSAEDNSIVGFSMIGSEAGEVVAVIQTAMLAKLPYTLLRDAVISDLTMAEGFGPLFANAPERKTN